ncbi:hypothetical protein CGCA056_v003395 [Colletotrichum aenigma]|uniref:uncharacterized protein n=1 Tax=Colletotrichum aenigma TaxID=1215731 RepID=UPI001872D1E8|nr:uncharacterized protein CGCA056_v003395 [Colletotrichum aenigma]KAF5525846.1 hypothetical protein CGCA056_v003395 [Colletotrichum aenigma]
MKSYIGCPLYCAVQGLLFMAADEDHSSSHLAGILSGYHGALATQDTIKYLCHAGASLDTTFTHIYPGESILEVAFRSTLLTGSLSVPTILVKLGISIREKDVERADRVFQSFNGVSSSQHEERFKASLQPFIESLDQRADRSAMVLRLCSLAWEAALYAKLEFTFDVMAIDTQVTLSINDLETQAIASTKACNLTVLRKIMSDPRLDAASIADSKGDSLLHLALLEFRDNTKKNLEVARLLINAGCDVLRSNNFGLQPLHCWDWRLTWRKVIWPKEVDSEPFRDLMRMMTKEGAHCNSQDQFEATALHYRINSSYHFQAILDTQPIEEIKAGLEIIDKKGYTPLAYMVKAGALQSFSILVKRVTVTPAMMASPVPILSLAVNADADEVFDFLIPLNSNSDVEPNDSPLHYLGPGASARNTRRLKSLYPDACACRLHGKTPLEAYLERCLKKGAVAEVDPDVMGELSVLDSDKADIADLSKVWERFAQYAVASESEEAVTSAGMSLLKLGYLRVFEKQNGVSGILPMVSSFNDIQTTLDLAPVSTRLLCQILRQTDGNSSLRERPEICRLLGAAARSLDFELANLLFSNGVSVHRRVDGLSVLEAYCKSPPDVPDTPRAKEMFDLLLDHAEKKQLNDCSPGRKGLAAIHLGEEEGAEWMVEKLVQRGADPNLRVRDDMHSNTALVHHLLNFSPN